MGARPRGAQHAREREHHDEQREGQHRHDDEHPDADHGAGPRLQDDRLRVAPSPREQAEQRGPDPVEQVGDAGDVGQDVVAVEADQRRQLPHHLQDLGRDHQQQRVVLRRPPHAGDGHRHDGVEVQAAEVGDHPPPPAEAVGVGDVGVERGPHEVDPGPHRAGRGPAATRARRVAELVEAGRQDRHGDDEQQQPRVLEGLVGRRGQPLAEEDPPAHQAQREQHRHDDQRVEQLRERRRQPTGAVRVGDGVLEPQRQQGVGPRDVW